MAGLEGVLAAAVEAVAIFVLAMHHGLWPLAILIVLAIEIGLVRFGRVERWQDFVRLILPKVPLLLVGIGAVIIVAISPRIATQLAVAVFYGGWRVWWGSDGVRASKSLPGLLVASAVSFEAVFLIAAVWRTSDNAGWIEFLVLALVWLC